MVTHNRIHNESDDNQNPDPLETLINLAKMELASETYKKMGLNCVEKSQQASKCPCPVCSLVASIETVIATAAMTGFAALRGDTRMLDELLIFIDGMRERYPNGAKIE